jgi:hypothetical protein
MMIGSPHCAHDAAERERDIENVFFRGGWTVSRTFNCMTFPSTKIPFPDV